VERPASAHEARRLRRTLVGRRNAARVRLAAAGARDG
jgi:hypothetical protein